MKLELKIGEEISKKAPAPETPSFEPEGRNEVIIDIAQVMAANQALLKNISLKMESLENRLAEMEDMFRRQQKAHRLNQSQRQLLLAPPPLAAKWEPAYPPLNEEYFSRFSWFDQLFRPEKLRRPGVE